MRAVLVALAALAFTVPLPGQVPGGSGGSGQARVVEVALSADTVALGDRFTIEIRVELPQGAVIFLPDSIEGEGYAPLGPMEWSVERGEERRVVSALYPMIAFDVGTIEMPDFAIFTADEVDSEVAGLSMSGSAVGSWSGLRDGTAQLPSTRMLPVGGRSLWVASVLVLDENTGSVQPRGAADVLGADRHWLSTVLIVVFGLTLGSAITVAAHDLVTGPGLYDGAAADPRARVMSELDVLLADGPHRRGETRFFYERSSDIVRGYVEGLGEGWTRTLTATELMGALSSRRRDDATRSLVGEMWAAEVVKFGGARPDVVEAEAYWRVLRDWVADASVSTGDAPDAAPTAEGGAP